MIVRCHTDTEHEGALVANVFGPLDEPGALKIWAAVVAELSDGHGSLLIDLSEVDLITSAGVGALVRLFHRIQGLGGALALYGANPRVAQVIESVMLAQILNLCGTLEGARERLNG